ncbi:cytochrome oxidase complex assembly protein 1-domain-containing protein [Pseudomassariella vexata]|uniref:Cytochrome oxidase complex assembly protein 1-domain-containing protein n=1 Tax=Pseudomassariella vexata TaxID=1141098 RepID=A0A1Y2DYK8_9PEZI|nr:cytochrome oxidase complex assembly protein 1-domain-containing protein [Pseudomassariella vexata]ORY64398.1 cytochrome oxidase complex assembly protein 1-domain-containing protein [Pseudomassariella vexata]
MFSRIVRSRILPVLRSPTCRTVVQRRTLVRAPKAGDGPLMERRSDRELPSVESVTFRWRHTFPIFVVLIVVSSVAIFNYQKLSSPIVASTLYSLRMSRKAREYLGDEIYFKHQIPWISGEMNQLRGRIDIRFSVKGSKNTGVMRFTSFRQGAKSMFETTEWSLERTDGGVIDLLDGEDPFKGIAGIGMDDEEKEEATRGFRQQLK